MLKVTLRQVGPNGYDVIRAEDSAAERPAIIARVCQNPTAVDPGWRVIPRTSTRSTSRKSHATPEAAIRSYGWRVVEAEVA